MGSKRIVMFAVSSGTQRLRPGFEPPPWPWTLACGALKIAIAASALVVPLAADRPMAAAVGWMLLLGGAAEFALGWGAHRTTLGKVTLGSGAVPIVAGILFINSGWEGLFPLTTVTMIWLLLRGILSLDVGILARASPAVDWFWLVLRGVMDIVLGLSSLLGLRMVLMAALLFDETSEIVSSFRMVLAISFAVAAIALAVMAGSQRGREQLRPVAVKPAR